LAISVHQAKGGRAYSSSFSDVEYFLRLSPSGKVQHLSSSTNAGFPVLFVYTRILMRGDTGMEGVSAGGGQREVIARVLKYKPTS
jgi:hypothetical protein